MGARTRGFRSLPCHSVNTWSRRRESNPRQTALQAATFATRSLRPVRAQDDSNVRLLLRRKPCSPLHHEPEALPAGLEPALPPSEGGALSTGPWKPVPDRVAFTPALAM